ELHPGVLGVDTDHVALPARRHARLRRHAVGGRIGNRHRASAIGTARCPTGPGCPAAPSGRAATRPDASARAAGGRRSAGRTARSECRGTVLRASRRAGPARSATRRPRAPPPRRMAVLTDRAPHGVPVPARLRARECWWRGFRAAGYGWRRPAGRLEPLLAGAWSYSRLP